MEQHTAGTGGNLPEKRKIDCESSDSGYVNSPSKIAKIESKTPGSPASLGGPGLARRTLSSDNLAVMCGGVGGVGEIMIGTMPMPMPMTMAVAMACGP